MENPLWTEKYAPNLDDIRQDSVRKNVRRAEGMNIILSGPRGCGKTAVARAVSKDTHGSRDRITEVNVADFFNRSKKEIRNDPRFESFLKGRSRMAKRDMINHVIKELSSYEPVGSSNYKIMLLDNAEAIREDFQQSLRRIIERHHETTQFIIATRQASKIIPAIQSRFYTIPVRKPDKNEVYDILNHIMDSEGVEYTESGVTRLVEYSGRNIRKSLMTAQSVCEQEDSLNIENLESVVSEVDDEPDGSEVLKMATDGDYGDMRDRIDEILSDRGYTSSELLASLNRTVELEYTGQDVVQFQKMAGETDMRATEGRSGNPHISKLLIEWSS